MATNPCRRCNTSASVKGRALCRACLNENRRINYKTNPDVKVYEKSKYDKKKNDPDFIESNRARARAWNKKKREEKRRGKE